MSASGEILEVEKSPRSETLAAASLAPDESTSSGDLVQSNSTDKIEITANGVAAGDSASDSSQVEEPKSKQNYKFIPTKVYFNI